MVLMLKVTTFRFMDLRARIRLRDGVDVESDDVQIYGPPGKNPPAGRYLW